MGTKFIGRGIITLIPVIIILIFIVFFTDVASDFAEDAPSEVTEIINEVSSSPFYGQTTRVFGNYDQATLEWGFGPGAFLFIIAMLLFLFAAALEIIARCNYYEVPEPEEEVKALFGGTG